jgi:hypothetical protein
MIYKLIVIFNGFLCSICFEPNTMYNHKHQTWCSIKNTVLWKWWPVCAHVNQEESRTSPTVFDILTVSQWPSGLVERWFHGCGTSVTLQTWCAETTIFWPSLFSSCIQLHINKNSPMLLHIMRCADMRTNHWVTPDASAQMQMPLCVRETKRCESENTDNNAMPTPDKECVLSSSTIPVQ